MTSHNGKDMHLSSCLVNIPRLVLSIIGTARGFKRKTTDIKMVLSQTWWPVSLFEQPYIWHKMSTFSCMVGRCQLANRPTCWSSSFAMHMCPSQPDNKKKIFKLYYKKKLEKKFQVLTLIKELLVNIFLDCLYHIFYHLNRSINLYTI